MCSGDTLSKVGKDRSQNGSVQKVKEVSSCLGEVPPDEFLCDRKLNRKKKRKKNEAVLCQAAKKIYNLIGHNGLAVALQRHRSEGWASTKLTQKQACVWGHPASLGLYLLNLG